MNRNFCEQFDIILNFCFFLLSEISNKIQVIIEKCFKTLLNNFIIILQSLQFTQFKVHKKL
jgi:hypothetical protein